jgi:small subunit ribosomal protein S6
MPLYENTFIIRQDVSSNEVNKITEEFSNLITDNDGKILKTEQWGLRNLAYKIKKNKKGHYVMLGIEASDNCIKELERRMKINENILKNVAIRVDSLDKEASPIMNNRSYEESEQESKETETEIVEEFKSEQI